MSAGGFAAAPILPHSERIISLSAGACNFLVSEMWADPNLKSFQGRVTRIEKAHRKGYGFEAPGTQGRSTTFRRPRTWGSKLRAALVVLTMGLVLKAVILFNVGDEVYDRRVAVLATGTGIDPFAARLMSADPVTRLIAAFLGEVFPAH